MDVDDDAGFVAEGDDIDEAAPDSSEVVINTGKVAVLVKVSLPQRVDMKRIALTPVNLAFHLVTGVSARPETPNR